MNVAYNMDCMEYMKTLPDNYFELCVADPPYGDALGNNTRFDFRNGQGRFDKYGAQERDGKPYNRIGGWFDRYKEPVEDGRDLGGEVRKKIIAWDVAPKKEYFDELFRVSRNQIIWGGNYFDLPPTRCFIVWRKLTISENFSMAMAEYAWTSFNDNAKVFECAPQGKVGDERFHPTQKPIDLYRWLFSRYAKQGDKIFDPYLGSGSSRIAAYDAGLDFVGCEIDKTYFKKQEERFANYTAQLSLFSGFAQEEML